LTKIIDKVAELTEKKPWVAEEEKKDVLDKVEETRAWLAEELEK